jgi:cell wall assembly regulator SMI1
MATITELWLRYTALLKEKLPPLYARLNPPASQKTLDKAKKDYKISENPFFSELVEILKINNGGTVGFELIPIEYMFPDPLGHYAWLKEDFEDEPTIYYSIPKGYVKTTYLCKNWIEFASDGIGGGLYIDLEPSEKGKKGQIISFHRDEEQRVVFADSLSDFLLALIKKLETGDYCLETTEGKENQAGQFFYNFRFTKIDCQGSLFVYAMNMLGIVDEENDLLGARKR